MPAHPDAKLAAAGLSPVESAAYELVVAEPGRTVADLDRSWIRPEPLRGALAALRTAGLVLAGDDDPPTYLAVDPAVALDAPIREYERQLQAAREHLQRLAAVHRAHDSPVDSTAVLEVVSGRSAVLERLAYLQRAARVEIRCLDKPPYLAPLTTSVSVELLRRGVRSRTVYERSSLEQPGALHGLEQLVAAGQQARVLPALPVKLYLADDRHGLLVRRPGDEGENAVLLRPCALLDALNHLFEGLWRSALPLQPATASPSSHRPPVEHGRLVALLLSGLTDQATARQLGVGYRTAQRHIANLMAALGARTRFQAGVQAARREQHLP
ncbi:LuxR family transcriptional regulator [Micromonospora chokoriensis]|uniref:LuxR family transcriptional regulator n=1 Tax=Micromonospora chokoriensis TaxID=356851 RepID=UPI00068C94FF|nr:LuxR family transcriptional regulator [Micromonospora chokoriensis]